MTDEDLAAEQALYGQLIRQTLSDHGAFVVENGPDEHHAIFQMPNQVHAAQAVIAGLDLLQHIAIVRHVRLQAGATPLRVSIGIHTVDAPENRNNGVGISARWEDALPITRRLGELNRQTPFPAVFVTGHTHRWLQQGVGWHIEHLGDSCLDDSDDKHPVYAILCPMQ
ncbi:MAG: hypothetical protein KC425_13310 [Anaerolineales bacterium]|nr:hypothetical protein [Anaerolineales bacterium]